VHHAQNDNDQIQTRAAPSWMTNEDNDYVNGVSHEWERSTYGQYVTSQIDRRMAANPRARRQSPLEPNPPSAQVYDHLYPSAHDQNFPESHGTALVQSQYHQQRQQQQYQQGFANANVIASQQVSHLVAANNMALIHSGVAYNYPPNAIAGFNMIFTPATATVPSAMVGPVVTPPKGPKDRHTKAELRSKALNNFLNNYGQPRSKFELRYIFGHVVEFSGDQQGSRYIQERLEEGLSTEEKDALFKEIQPNALQVIMDVFGNYVIQKFFEHGDQTQKRILASYLKGRVAELSAQTYACRVVQKVSYAIPWICV
jgi:mRNA-binding protein PUF3